MSELDPVIHVPARLRVVVALSALPAGERLTFARLQEMLGLTAGNLITHLRKLEDAGYVTTTKSKRTTTAELTDQGRRAFADYKALLSAMLQG